MFDVYTSWTRVMQNAIVQGANKHGRVRQGDQCCSIFALETTQNCRKMPTNILFFNDINPKRNDTWQHRGRKLVISENIHSFRFSLAELRLRKS